MRWRVGEPTYEDHFSTGRDREIEWRLVAGIFGLVFLAEIGDKTQLAVMLLSAESGSPLSVFLGASLALIFSTFLAVFFGAAISRVVPAEYLRLVAGGIFLMLGAFLIINR